MCELLERILDYISEGRDELYTEEEDEDDEMYIKHIHTESFLEFFNLLYRLLNPDEVKRIDAKKAFLSGFSSNYIADSLEYEKELALKGVFVDGRTMPNGKKTKPCVVVLRPDTKLGTFSLLNAAHGEIVLFYGGVLQTPPSRCDSSAKFSSHTLPTQIWNIDGTPGNAKSNVTLQELIYYGCVGPLASSSRIHPSKSSKDSKDCNTSVERIGENLITLDSGEITGKHIGCIAMRSNGNTRYGEEHAWDYDWDNFRDCHAHTEEEIEELIAVYEKRRSIRVQRIVDAHRKFALANGHTDDF